MTELKIRKWGNSQGIRLPKSIMEACNMKVNDVLVVKTEPNKMILEVKNSKNKITLKELFKDYHDDYKGQAYDWGNPVGNEIW